MNTITDKDGNVVEVKPVTENTPTMSAHTDEKDKDVNELLKPDESKETAAYDNGIFEEEEEGEKKEEH